MLGYDLWRMADATAGTLQFAADDTMMGIIPRAMNRIFSEIGSRALTGTVVSVSYMELYNDMKLYDLLSPTESAFQSLDIREAKGGEIVVPSLTKLQVMSMPEVLEALWSGAKLRHVAATDMNDYSSRSHTIFVVNLVMPDPSTPGSQIVAKLNLVDLAGSEKWKSSQLSALTAERVKELTSINRSLSALGNCVSALMRKNRSHVPFRDSKLTRLLQDSLGGNTLTLFVVTLSASVKNIEETASTLQFADRAMKVQILATKNSIPCSGNESTEKLRMEIKNLKALLHAALSKTSECMTSPNAEGKTSIVEQLHSEVQDLRDENIRVLQILKSTQEQLQYSQEENIRMLSFLERIDCGKEAAPLKGARVYGEHSLDQFPDDLKTSILQARSEEIDRRLIAAENIEAIQEERWGLLMNYHNWLQSQTTTSSSTQDIGIAASDVYKKVQLMEGSILAQADELRRAKKVFLQVK